MSKKINHDLFCECNHRMYEHSSMSTHKCFICACTRFKLTSQYIRIATKWTLFRIAWMLLFDDYRREYSTIGKYTVFFTNPSKWQLAWMVLRRDTSRLAVESRDNHGLGCNNLTMFSINLNYEFVVEYLVPDNEL